MESMSTSQLAQIETLQMEMRTLCEQIEDSRKQLSLAEDRMDKKVRDLWSHLTSIEEKQDAGMHVLPEEMKKIHTNVADRSFGDNTTQNEAADIFLENKSHNQSFEKNPNPPLSDIAHDEDKLIIGISNHSSTSEAEISENIKPSSVCESYWGKGGIIARTLGGVLQDDSDVMKTSKTFHMHNVAVISDHNNSSGYVWFITLFSFLITISQLLVLNTISLEASHPPCVSHEDCRAGEYCQLNSKLWRGVPRCDDCMGAMNKSSNSNCTSVLDEYIDFNHPNFQIDSADLAWKINFDYNDSELDCFAQTHCSKNDISTDECDFLVMNIYRWHSSDQFALIFMALLFSVILCSDIQDSIVEEIYLNDGLKNDPLKPMTRLAAEALRLAIRSRQIVIPWYSTATAVAIIITDPLDAKNAVLNMLTIDVILLADNMLATLFLPLFNQYTADKLINNESQHDALKPMILSRIHGICAASTLVLIVYFIEPLITIYNYNQGTCSAILSVLFYGIMTIPPACVILLHGVGHVILDNKSRTICKSVLRGVGEIIRDCASFISFATLSWGIILFSTMDFFLGAREYVTIATILLLLWIAFNVAVIFSTWKPIQKLNANLFKDGEV